MGEGTHHEANLERELDNLYRKVSGLEPSEDRPDREEPKAERAVSTPAGITLPRKKKPVRGRGRRPRFRVAAVAWTFAAILLVAGIIALLYPLVGYRHGTLNVGGIDYPSKTHRLTGETRYFDGIKWLRPPGNFLRADGGQKDPTLGGSPAVKKEITGLGTAPVVTIPAPRGETYAIQLRAYPEDQETSAVAFLKELRKGEPDASLETVRISGRGVWHRILIGHFPTTEAAADYRLSRGLASEYPYSFIQRRSGDHQATP